MASLFVPKFQCNRGCQSKRSPPPPLPRSACVDCLSERPTKLNGSTQRCRQAPQGNDYAPTAQRFDPHLLRQPALLRLLLHRYRAVLRAAVPSSLHFAGQPSLRSVAQGMYTPERKIWTVLLLLFVHERSWQFHPEEFSTRCVLPGGTRVFGSSFVGLSGFGVPPILFGMFFMLPEACFCRSSVSAWPYLIRRSL